MYMLEVMKIEILKHFP